MKRILVSCRQMQAVFSHFAEVFDANELEADLPDVEQQLLAADLVPIIGDYHGVIAGDDQFSADVLDAAKQLEIISKWGVGVDGIDREAAARLGIRVTNTPGDFDDVVADVCVGYLLLLARKLHEIDRGVRAGGWPKPTGIELAGRTLGIVGLGGIGRALARRAIAMRMNVVGYDVAPASLELAVNDGVRCVLLDELLRASDTVSLNCPLTAATRHILNRESLGLLKPGAFVINTGRGALVDEPALVDRLRDGAIGGAALDVFESEPLPTDSPLRELPNVILGAHNASNTSGAVMRVSEQAVRNLLEGLRR